MKPIVNVFEAPVTDKLTHGEHFEVRMAQLAAGLGAQDIGANLTRVAPGKAAFPFHHHHANEEHFYVVRGNGVLRFGAETFPVKPGDYIVTPAGGPDRAHQLVNTGHEDLVYLSLSTKKVPEVVGYPDSGKTGVRLAPPGPSGPGRFIVDDAARDKLGYYDREDGARVRDLVASAKKAK